jgi:hypothetical protein
MEKTLRDIPDIPKKILANKKISLYKAFILHDDDEMNINVNIDILSLTIENALDQLIQTMSFDEIHALKTVNLAVLSFNKSELMDKPLIDEGDIFYDNGSISITLKDKLYDVSVKDITLVDLAYDIDPKTERKTITYLTFNEV